MKSIIVCLAVFFCLLGQVANGQETTPEVRLIDCSVYRLWTEDDREFEKLKESFQPARVVAIPLVSNDMRYLLVDDKKGRTEADLKKEAYEPTKGTLQRLDCLTYASYTDDIRKHHELIEPLSKKYKVITVWPPNSSWYFTLAFHKETKISKYEPHDEEREKERQAEDDADYEKFKKDLEELEKLKKELGIK